MAYFYMPLIFTLLGYSIAYVALHPVLEMLQALGSMVIAQEVPDFDNGLKSIYDASNADANSSNKTVSIDDIVFPDYETHYGDLTCDRIGLKAPVYWGDSKLILKAGVGNYNGSFMPGFGRPILLSGHNTTYFKPFKNIIKGDVFVFKTNYGTFQYKVTEVKVINEVAAKSMLGELLSAKDEKLVLYTCYPFETLIGRKTDRLFVFADKISGPTVK
jgi:LPXTG-site transpeptidase (sortase) family protein